MNDGFWNGCGCAVGFAVVFGTVYAAWKVIHWAAHLASP